MKIRHRLGRTGRTIVEILNRKTAETVFEKKLFLKLEDIGISKIASDVLPDSSSIATENDDDLRNIQKKETSHVPKSLPILSVPIRFGNRNKTEDIIFDF